MIVSFINPIILGVVFDATAIACRMWTDRLTDDVSDYPDGAKGNFHTLKGLECPCYVLKMLCPRLKEEEI